MPARISKVYHITTYACATKILDTKGIDPEFSQGRRRVCWYVAKYMIPWAIAHVAQRKECAIADLVILFARGDSSVIQRTSKAGVYCSSAVLKPLEMDSAVIWLQRQEHRVFVKDESVRGNGWRGRPNKEEDELS